METGVIETDITDHFPTFLISDSTDTSSHSTTTTIHKRVFNEPSITKFRQLLLGANWELIKETKNPNDSYNLFLKLFTREYNSAFPKRKFNIKAKTLLSPWMSKGLLKSSKKKQKLYEKFLKNKTHQNEKKYKGYKNLFEKIKHLSRKTIIKIKYN